MQAKPRIIMNNDANDLWFLPAGTMKRRDLEGIYERLLQGTQVDVLAWNGAVTDTTCFYNSKVGDGFWYSGDGKTKKKRLHLGRNNVTALIEAGDDPLEVVTTLAHRLGIKLVASMRMNDTHHWHESDEKSVVGPGFFIDHPEWRLDRAPGEWSFGMNYAVEGVREHRFAIIREMAEEYDTDGVELDFGREEYVFQPDEARDNAPIMTEFVGRVRRLLEGLESKRGRGRLILGVRCPSTIDRSLEQGLDVPTWIKEGWVDYVCPSWRFYIDLNTPVAEWVEFTKGTNCGIYPTIWESAAYEYVSGHSMEEIKAAAHSFYLQGAAGMSTFNLRRKDILCLAGDVLMVGEGPRHYVWAGGGGRGGHLFANVRDLPRFGAGDVGKRKSYGFRFVEKVGEVKKAVLWFKVTDVTKEDEFAFDLNGKRLSSEVLGSQFRVGRPWWGNDGRLGYYVQYEVPLREGMLVVGDNELGAVQVRKNPDLPQVVCEMRELEIMVEP